MFRKLEKRTQEWLISSLEHWTDALLRALGEFADTKQSLQRTTSFTPQFSRPCDMGLFVEGEKADEALDFGHTNRKAIWQEKILSSSTQFRHESHKAKQTEPQIVDAAKAAEYESNSETL